MSTNRLPKTKMRKYACLKIIELFFLDKHEIRFV